jgi:hypothetical protein
MLHSRNSGLRSLGSAPSRAFHRTFVTSLSIKEPVLRSLQSALARSSSLAFLAAGASALVLGLAGPVGAQSIPGPLKVTDSGPSGSPGYAIKGITGFQNDVGVFGYGNAASSAINIDGVTGYVQTPQSVGVVGWSSSTGTSAYGVFGHSDTGPGVFGFNADGGAASVYGMNASAGGVAVFGNSSAGLGVSGIGSLDGVQGQTTNASAGNFMFGTGGFDVTSGNTNSIGTAGATNNASGYGIYGQAFGGGIGAWGRADTGLGLLATSGSGLGAEIDQQSATGGIALMGLATGEGVESFGFSGTAADPALSATDEVGSTDLFGTYGFNGGNPVNETFIVQAGTLDNSGAAFFNGSDVQVSGDLYVTGGVYDDCNLANPFPETDPSDCGDDIGTAHLRSTGAAVHTYRPSVSIPTIEDLGEAQMTNGQASVTLESTFAQTIDPKRSYLVFITPEGDSKGLYVTNKSASGFVVRESQSGHSTLAFQYRIVAHPFGNTEARLAPGTARTKHGMRLGHFANVRTMKAAHRMGSTGVLMPRTPARPAPAVFNKKLLQH